VLASPLHHPPHPGRADSKQFGDAFGRRSIIACGDDSIPQILRIGCAHVPPCGSSLSHSWGPRLEYVLYAALAALLECQNTSILGVLRMLVDSRYRSWVLKQVEDPIVRSFWLEEFAGYDKAFRAEVIAPIQNKVGQLLARDGTPLTSAANSHPRPAQPSPLTSARQRVGGSRLHRGDPLYEMVPIAPRSTRCC
jgi:hypothetical protein